MFRLPSEGKERGVQRTPQVKRHARVEESRRASGLQTTPGPVSGDGSPRVTHATDGDARLGQNARAASMAPALPARRCDQVNSRLQAQLIEDLLDLSRIATGKLRLEFPLELSRHPIEAVQALADAKSRSGSEWPSIPRPDPSWLIITVFNRSSGTCPTDR